MADTVKDLTEKLRHAYSVTNIQQKVRLLDGVKITYTQWVKLFQIQVKAYQVADHIDGTAPPAKTDPTFTVWSEIDSVILQWIYGSISDELFARIIDTNSTARDAWIKLQDIFQNNKGSRAAALEQEFSTITVAACSSMDAYFKRIHDLAVQLNDLGRTVDENRKVLQLVRGLPQEYDTVASFINQSSPSWDEARNMVLLEVQRLAARQNSTQSALVSSQNPPPNPTSNQIRNPDPSTQYQNRPYDNSYPRYNNRGGRGGRRNNRGGRSYNPRSRYPPNPNSSFASAPNPPAPYYPAPNNTWPNQPNHPPPSPYPSQPYGPNNYPYQPTPYVAPPPQPTVHFSAQPATYGQPPAQAQYATNFDALSPTDLSQAAYQAQQFTQPTGQWVMDSGASQHLTANQGTPNWQAPFPPQ